MNHRPSVPAASASASRPARCRSATGPASASATGPHQRHPRPHPDRPGVDRQSAWPPQRHHAAGDPCQTRCRPPARAASASASRPAQRWTPPPPSASASRPDRPRSAADPVSKPATIPHRRHPRPHPDRPGARRIRRRRHREGGPTGANQRPIAPAASASASRPGRRRAATSQSPLAPRRSRQRKPSMERTIGIRVRIPTGPALIGIGTRNDTAPAASASAFRPARR